MYTGGQIRQSGSIDEPKVTIIYLKTWFPGFKSLKSGFVDTIVMKKRYIIHRFNPGSYPETFIDTGIHEQYYI